MTREPHHDARHTSRLPQSLEHDGAFPVWKREVEQHEIRRVAEHCRHGVGHRGGNGNPMTRLLEEESQRPAHELAVLHDQHVRDAVSPADTG